MRIKYAVKNTVASLGSYLYLFIFGIYIRKLFLETFSLEYLGYEGLFSSIFLLLSIAEFGAGGMFNYMLYSAIARNDNNEIRVVMGMYKKLYALIGIVVFVTGAGFFFLLPVIITDEVSNWNYVRIIYTIQLLTTFVTYFLAYRRSIFIVNQQSREVVRIDTIYKTMSSVTRIAVILVFQNYIGYLLIPFITNIASNLHIYVKSKKSYPEVFGYKASWNDFIVRDSFKQLKSLIVTKISTVIYTASDNVIITRMAGITAVGLYSNYNQIFTFGVQAVWNAISPLNESTGNLLHSESREKSKNFFEAFDFFSYLLGAVGLTVIGCTFQKIIAFLYGEQFLISEFAVIAMSEDFYVRERGAAYNAFQNAVGHYETTKVYSIISATANIVLSIIFGIKWGIVGILAATVIGNIFIQAGRAHVVYKWIFYQKKSVVIIKEVFFLLTANLSFVLSFWLSHRIDSNLWGILICVVISVFIPVSMGCFFYFKSNMLKYMRFYIVCTILEIKNKRKLEEGIK